jgi:hypothetical protein
MKVKEKIISNLNDLVKDKQSEDIRDIFKNVFELDLFTSKVQEYDKIREKLKLHSAQEHETPQPQFEK